MLEILSPAGSPEALQAAVQSGADAVYMGYGKFNARRNAKNFSQEEFAAAVSYCHQRGVKLYLTLNTLLTDRELPQAAQLAAEAAQLGVDAVLVQDLGVLRMLRQVAPTLPVHGSTQLTIHNLDGVLRCAELGMERVVLSRELSREDISYICQKSPIEIEVFAHGALCMSYSGQCYFSSVIGGRSGNRGLCAQPCRLKYGWGDHADGNPLSLKDMSLAGHLQELEQIGVTCIKLEGRMKRPEYVAVVTSIYARAVREKREPTQEEIRQLEAAFSRQGFTDGYFVDHKGPDMFGIREEGAEPTQLFAQAKASYSRENPRVPVKFYAMIRPGEPVQVGVEDNEGRVATAAGPVPEAARTVAITSRQVEAQLSKTGGTPYRCEQVRALVESGLSVPLSALNGLRRAVLEDLNAQRAASPRRETAQFSPGARYENPKEPPVLTVSLRKMEQLSRELEALEPALCYLPVEELFSHLEQVRALLDRGKTRLAAVLPRIVLDREIPQLRRQLECLRQAGIDEVLVGSLGLLRLAQEFSFIIRGDYGLNLYNSQALKEVKRMGLRSAAISFELKLAQIRDISKALDIEMIVYGRLPLMITENCIIRNRAGQCGCDNVNQLTDRTGARFPVLQAPGCRNEIFNAKKLFLADKQKEYQRVGAWGARLMFTTENPRECVQVTERYLGRGCYEPNDFTRGLYYREVE